MKKIFLVLLFILIAASCSGDGVKMIGRDFWVDDPNLVPISFGVASWTDNEIDFGAATFLNFSLINLWDNHLRFGMGAAYGLDDVMHDSNFRLITTATTVLFKHLELGVYGTPFYNLIDGTDDPFGVTVGYAFGF